MNGAVPFFLLVVCGVLSAGCQVETPIEVPEKYVAAGKSRFSASNDLQAACDSLKDEHASSRRNLRNTIKINGRRIVQDPIGEGPDDHGCACAVGMINSKLSELQFDFLIDFMKVGFDQPSAFGAAINRPQFAEWLKSRPKPAGSQSSTKISPSDVIQAVKLAVQTYNPVLKSCSIPRNNPVINADQYH
jgi:hypothetical protein